MVFITDCCVRLRNNVVTYTTAHPARTDYTAGYQLSEVTQ